MSDHKFVPPALLIDPNKPMKKSPAFLLSRLVVGSSLALFTSLHAAPLDVIQQWNFNTDGVFEGWADAATNRLKGPLYDGVSNFDEEQVLGGVLRAKVIATDPNLVVTGLSLSASQVGYVKMRYRVLNADGVTPVIPPPNDLVLTTPTNGASQGSASSAPNSSVVVDAVNGWTINTWDLTDVYGGPITTLRVDPVNSPIDGGNGTFEIDYIQVLETDVAPPLVVEVDPPAIDPKYTLVREWTSDADWAKWPGTNFTVNSITGGILNGTSTTGDANLNCTTATNFGTTITGPVSGVYVFEYKLAQSTAAGGSQQIFWADSAGGITGGRSVTTTQTDTSSRVVRSTLKNLVSGDLNGLRIDPGNVTGVTTDLDYFRVYVDSTMIGWDTDSVTAAAQGGTGTWNKTDLSFFNGTVNSAWPSSSNGNNDAIFAATAGTVAVAAGGITANDLRFYTTGYSLTGGPLTLDGATSQLTAAAGVAATINAPLTRSAPLATDLLSVTGPGTLTFGGGGTIPRKWHFKTCAALAAGTFTSSGASDAASNGLVVFNGSTLTMNGATLNRTNGDGDDALYVGNPATTGDFAGSTRVGNLVVNAGSSLTASGGRGLSIAFGASNNSSMTVNGGTVNANPLYVGWNGVAVLNIAGGTVTANPGDASGVAVRHSDSGSGVINLSGGELKAGNLWLAVGDTLTSAVSLTVNLDAGATLETERIRLSKGAATGTFTLACNFDGGTLRLPAAAPTGSSGNILGDITDTGGGTTSFAATIEDGGLILDTNGRDTSVTTSLVHDATLGATVDGGLRKKGSGKLTLAVDNSYTGPTFVEAGTLSLATASLDDTADVLITTGGTLDLAHGTPDTIDELKLNGVALAAGVYGAIGSGAQFERDYLTGMGMLIVTTGGGIAPYDQWATGNGYWSPGAAKSLPAEDFDGDGIANIAEFAFAGNPTTGADSGKRYFSTVSGHLVLTVAVRTGTAAQFAATGAPVSAVQDGVLYSVRGSATLDSFPAIVEKLGSVVLGDLPPSPPAGYEYASFRLQSTVSGNPKGFLQAYAAQ